MTRKTASSGKALLVTAGFLATVLVFGLTGAAGADSFILTKVAETNSTITFSYPQQAGFGYLYSANGAVVSRTYDPTRTQVRFSKANSYEVAAIVKGATGSYPTVTPPPPSPQCSDNADNDGDGKIDYPADPGCSSATDNDETDLVQPPPSTLTPSQFQARVAAGATVQNVTVTGSVSINVANFALLGSTVQGHINLGTAANHVTLDQVHAVDFVAHGSDYITVTGGVFDGGPGQSCQNFIWSGPNRDPAAHWTITGNTFRNYQCESPHSEALYIASDAAYGLIEGNTFTNNGSTSHIFFTWCNDQGGSQNLCAVYGQGNGMPHDWSVRGNTFYDTWRAYYAISIREELTRNGAGPVPGLNICVDNHQKVTGPIIDPPDYGGQLAEFIVPWGNVLLASSCPDPR